MGEFPKWNIADFISSNGQPNEAIAERIRELKPALRAAENKRDATQRTLAQMEAVLEGKTLTVERATFTVDPMSPLSEDSTRSDQTVQTIMTGPTIDSEFSRAAKQQRDAAAVRSLDSRRKELSADVEQADAAVRECMSQIAVQTARAGQLKADLESVTDELGRADEIAAVEDQKCVAIQSNAATLRRQTAQHEQRLEKVTASTASLRSQLEEMIRTRAVLETELADICNRERPEVRQLAEEIRVTKQAIEDHTARAQALQKRIAARRRETETPPDEVIALRLEIANLARRKSRWERARELDDAVPESERMAKRRKALAAEVLAKEKKLILTQSESALLTEHARLLEAAVAEKF
jgi:hypothetical protein